MVSPPSSHRRFAPVQCFWQSNANLQLFIALSFPRAQCDERIEYHPVDLQARVECALARAKCPLGRNADVTAAGLPWRRLDALDQSRYRDSNLWDEAAGAR